MFVYNYCLLGTIDQSVVGKLREMLTKCYTYTSMKFKDEVGMAGSKQDL